MRGGPKMGGTIWPTAWKCPQASSWRRVSARLLARLPGSGSSQSKVSWPQMEAILMERPARACFVFFDVVVQARAAADF